MTNRTHGHLPGAPDAAWLNAKIHTHPERLDELIGEQLPRLLDTLDGNPAYWFVRYRSACETDHLRLRIRTRRAGAYAASVAAVGAWAQQLGGEGMVGRLVLDTYYPETGRYGHGAVLEAAEDVFVADSRLVAAQLRHLPERTVSRDALVAVNLAATVWGFLGGTESAMRWLTSRPSPAAPPTDRAALDQAAALIEDGGVRGLPGWAGEVADTWQARADALSSYYRRLPADADTGAVLESLLHMHCNRAVGVDRDREAGCRRLTRHAALAWSARHGATDDRG